MEYIGFVFGIFGLLAYLETSALKKRIAKLERELTAMNGTGYHEDRQAMLKAARDCIGRHVEISFREDHEDSDIISCGNTAHGSNTILDADEEWMLVRVESAKGAKDKLIRMESVQSITARAE